MHSVFTSFCLCCTVLCVIIRSLLLIYFSIDSLCVLSVSFFSARCTNALFVSFVYLLACTRFLWTWNVCLCVRVFLLPTPGSGSFHFADEIEIMNSCHGTSTPVAFCILLFSFHSTSGKTRVEIRVYFNETLVYEWFDITSTQTIQMYDSIIADEWGNVFKDVLQLNRCADECVAIQAISWVFILPFSNEYTPFIAHFLSIHFTHTRTFHRVSYTCATIL